MGKKASARYIASKYNRTYIPPWVSFTVTIVVLAALISVLVWYAARMSADASRSIQDLNRELGIAPAYPGPPSAHVQIGKHEQWLNFTRQALLTAAAGEILIEVNWLGKEFQPDLPWVEIYIEGYTKRLARDMAHTIANSYLSQFSNEKIWVTVYDYHSLEKLYGDKYWLSE